MDGIRASAITAEQGALSAEVPASVMGVPLPVVTATAKVVPPSADAPLGVTETTSGARVASSAELLVRVRDRGASSSGLLVRVRDSGASSSGLLVRVRPPCRHCWREEINYGTNQQC
jgi:hypothetical protein